MAPRKLPESGDLPTSAKQGLALCITVPGPAVWDEAANESRTSHPVEAGTRSWRKEREFQGWHSGARVSTLGNLYCVQCLKAQNTEGPHHTERETESQRGDKNCPSSCSKGAAELKQKLGLPIPHSVLCP